MRVVLFVYHHAGYLNLSTSKALMNRSGSEKFLSIYSGDSVRAMPSVEFRSSSWPGVQGFKDEMSVIK